MENYQIEIITLFLLFSEMFETLISVHCVVVGTSMFYIYFPSQIYAGVHHSRPITGRTSLQTYHWSYLTPGLSHQAISSIEKIKMRMLESYFMRYPTLHCLICYHIID